MTPDNEKFQEIERIQSFYDSIPEAWRVTVLAAIYGACALLEDYSHTILDNCASMRLPYKKECRTLKCLLDSYARDRQYYIDREGMALEEDFALGIEDKCCESISTLCKQTAKVAEDMDEENLKIHYSAMAQALAVSAAIISYGKILDERIQKVFRVTLPGEFAFVPLGIERIHRYISRFVKAEAWAVLKEMVRPVAMDILKLLLECEKTGCELVSAKKFRRWTPAEERFVMLKNGFSDADNAFIISRSVNAFRKKRKELELKKQNDNVNLSNHRHDGHGIIGRTGHCEHTQMAQGTQGNEHFETVNAFGCRILEPIAQPRVLADIKLPLIHGLHDLPQGRSALYQHNQKLSCGVYK